MDWNYISKLGNLLALSLNKLIVIGYVISHCSHCWKTVPSRLLSKMFQDNTKMDFAVILQDVKLAKGVNIFSLQGFRKFEVVIALKFFLLNQICCFQLYVYFHYVFEKMYCSYSQFCNLKYVRLQIKDD